MAQQPLATITTAQPQPVTAMATQQPPVIPSNKSPESAQRALNVIRGLAISQLFMGSLCICFEFALLGLHNSTNEFRLNSVIGDGVWCGAWVSFLTNWVPLNLFLKIVVAGGIGIPASRQVSSRCVMTCLLAFSVVAAVFSATHFEISLGTAFQQHSTAGLALKIIQCLLSFASSVVLSISACYSGYLLPDCCQPYAFGQPQVRYGTSNPQQPTMEQQPGAFGVQSYVTLGHQSVPQMVQDPGIPSRQQMAPTTMQHLAHTIEQEAMLSHTGQPEHHTHVYSNLQS